MDAVDRGAELLDNAEPDWWRRIRLRKLNMLDDFECILGQLFGNFFDGLAELNISDGRFYGFDGAAADLLTVAWKDAVLDRKFADA